MGFLVREAVSLILRLVTGTTIPFGKSPYNPQAIKGHILYLTNSRFEIFGLSCDNFERYKAPGR